MDGFAREACRRRGKDGENKDSVFLNRNATGILAV